MNRVIKFRGKRVANGEWAYGSLLVWADGECTILEKSHSSDAMWKREIDADTVGQFVGQCDAAGKEIYEGDIVTWLFNSFVEQGVVIWSQPDGAWMVENRITHYPHRLISCRRNMRVRGNIYDNPELSKGGKQ